jgi:hypothetical protein
MLRMPSKLQGLQVRTGLYCSSKAGRDGQKNGASTDGELGIELPQDASLADYQSRLDLITETGLFFTAELMSPGMINVCLDDGEFDYKFEVLPNDERLHQGMLAIIATFDVDDYREAARLNQLAEMGMEPGDDGPDT